MDKNTIIGFVLIVLMLVGYQVLMPTPQEVQPVVQESSIPAPAAKEVTAPDSAQLAASLGDFAKAVDGQANDITVETEDLQLTFSTKGGIIKDAILRKYKTFDGKPLYLIKEGYNRFDLKLPTQKGDINLSDLYYTTSSASSNKLSKKDSSVITFRLNLAGDQYVEQTYVVHGEGYLIDYSIKANGVGLSDKALTYHWRNDFLQLENDIAENRKSVTINFQTDEFNSHSVGSDFDEKADKPVKWFTLKQKYFLAGFISGKTPLNNTSMKAHSDASDTVVVKTMQVNTQIPVAAIQQGGAGFQYFFGPNDYHLVKTVKAENFEENVYLGYTVLKPVNKYVLVPLFNFLEKFFSNYGLLIILLVVIIKLLLTPLTYKSYISMAKMRLLAPELEEIKQKNPDDMAKQQQDQMKLYQQVGVSPFSGCIPVLATMPILLSLFFLFPNLIELRQQPFLWAKDLSTYDSFIKLPFTIPFYGNHVSLFTLFMTLSSIAYAYYNNQMTPTQQGPVNMKLMSYIMPVMFMFVLNSFPAGLTFYYFVSNIVTIVQQLVIRRFVDEDKIRKVLEENKVKNADKPKQQSKFQKYLEKSLQAAEESRKKQEEAEKRQGKKK